MVRPRVSSQHRIPRRNTLAQRRGVGRCQIIQLTHKTYCCSLLACQSCHAHTRLPSFTHNEQNRGTKACPENNQHFTAVMKRKRETRIPSPTTTTCSTPRQAAGPPTQGCVLGRPRKPHPPSTRRQSRVAIAQGSSCCRRTTRQSGAHAAEGS